MAQCSRCGRDNPAGAASCSGCGADLLTTTVPPVVRAMAPRPVGGTPAPQVRCPACGVTVPQGLKFCNTCGAPLNPTPLSVSATPLKRGRIHLSALGSDSSVTAVWPLASEETSFGAAGDVRLSDRYADAREGRFVFRGNTLWFVPNQVLNGTFLLTRREHELPIGGEIRVGRQLLRLDAFPPAPPTAERLWGSPNPGYRFRVQQILAGGLEGDSFPLREGENLIARNNGDLSFPGDGYVSGKHAMLTARGDRVTVKDLGSSNGTFVRMIAETPVGAGDLLLVGEQLIRVDPG